MRESLSDKVAFLEQRYKQISELAERMIFTLEFNQDHFFRDDQPAREVFRDLVVKWKKRLVVAMHKNGR